MFQECDCHPLRRGWCRCDHRQACLLARVGQALCTTPRRTPRAWELWLEDPKTETRFTWFAKTDLAWRTVFHMFHCLPHAHTFTGAVAKGSRLDSLLCQDIPAWCAYSIGFTVCHLPVHSLELWWGDLKTETRFTWFAKTDLAWPTVFHASLSATCPYRHWSCDWGMQTRFLALPRQTCMMCLFHMFYCLPPAITFVGAVTGGS